MTSKYVLLYLYSCLSFFDLILEPHIVDDNNDLNIDKERKGKEGASSVGCS